MRAKKNCRLENISNRKNNWYIEFKDYTKSLSLPNSLSVWQSGHKNSCAPNHISGPATYDHYIIHYITDGRGTYTCNGYTWDIQKGDAFLISPFQTVQYQSDSVQPWKYYWVGFNGTDVSRLLSLCGYRDDILVIHYDDNDGLLTSHMNAITKLSLSGPALECGLTGHLYEIFSLLISVNQVRYNTISADYYYNALKYIRLNYASPELSVSEIADYIGINRSHLYRIFDQISHQSIKKFILDFRLQKAASLLKYTTSDIGDIAHSCGFSDQAYFSNCFKKNYHVSPSMYRKLPTETVQGADLP
ncbi:MAG: AraC family transcriptional regulator [Hungatella hathewayi]|nr:AraC family transcriptional regulator [Hungatella hathewayi]